jgi:hypothetical protein
MLIIYQLFLMLGVTIFLIGLGLILRWISAMLRGEGLLWGMVIFLNFVGAFGIIIGGTMVLYYWDLILPFFSQLNNL